MYTNGLPAFDVVIKGEVYTHIALQVGGDHNISNALAASAAAYVLGIPGEAVAEGLGSFTGAGRRFERKGEYNGAAIYDDYAHHPGELAATFEAVHDMGYKRVIVAFQPHTYTRTKALFHDFVKELRKADVVALAEIYAARERNTVGISSRDLMAHIPGSAYCETLPEVTAYLKSIAQPGDVIRLGDVTAALEGVGLRITRILEKEDWRCVSAKRRTL